MITFLVSAISIATVLLFGCVGEIITEKAGHLNLGIPGIMCMGTAGGCLGTSLYMGIANGNPSWLLLVLFSLVFSVIFAAATGAIYALLTVSLRCNQNITGLAITIFGAGATDFLMSFVDRTHFDAAGKLISSPLPFAKNLGWFGEIFLGHGVFVYIAIAVALACTFVLNKTRVGLHLRAVGESPATADAAGINVTAYKYVAILVGSGIAGLGGFYYIMDYIKGSWENASIIEAFGWLAIALVIFVLWKPHLGILGALLFGGCYIVAFVLANVTSTQKEIIKMLPYVITIVVLIVTSIFDDKENQPPASLGLPYFREDR
ncbi:MAG: ABC transporter permease [Clostridia bacterium]|nr:ABC transporter permease [Clostridia bacterium]